jgi:hypothetical protein
MSLKTCGSAAVDKAQLRLALLKSIDENLDLGHGLTIEAYNLINTTRAMVEANIAVPIQMRYNIRSRDVGARQCRAPTGVPHVNENRYNTLVSNLEESRKTVTQMDKVFTPP